MNLHDLKPGERVRLAEGVIAEITHRTEDGRWIRVRYVESPKEPSLVGTEDLCSEDEIEERVGSAT